jgi:transposase
MEWKSIVNFHFTRTNVHEVTQLETLLEPLWDLGNVYADSGYLSGNNCWVIVMKGGTPFIRPKRNTNGKTVKGRAFAEMIERYKQDKEEWMHKYHQRSNIEAVFSSLKRRLGGFVTSIKRQIQQIEIALKIIVYNLMILVKKRVEDEYF